MKVSFTFHEPARVTTVTLDNDGHVYLYAKGGKRTALTGEKLDAIVEHLREMQKLMPDAPPRPATTH